MTAQPRLVPPRSTGTRSKAGTVSVARQGRDREGPWEEIKFGDVVIKARRPGEADIRRSAEESTAALQRAFDRLRRPGVRIYPKKDVPLYWADPDNPDGIIRKLNGKIQHGVMLEDGQFQAID